MPHSHRTNPLSCNCCYGLWRPSWGRDRVLPGDLGRSWLLKKPVEFAAVRFGMALIGCIFLIFSAVTDKPPPEPGAPKFGSAWFTYWKFYTHWTLALSSLYYIISALFSYALYKNESHEPHSSNPPSGDHFSWEAEVQVAHPGPDEDIQFHPSQAHHRHHRVVSFGELCVWFTYETVWAASIFLACTFWVLMGLGCLPHKSCKKVEAHFWIAQVLNLAFIGTEMFLNKMPFIPMHSIITFGYCLLWLIFSTLLWFVTGQWVYPQSQAHGTLWSALTFWPGWIALNVVSFFFALLIEWGISRFIPAKHSMNRKHDCSPAQHHHRTDIEQELRIEEDTSAQ